VRAYSTFSPKDKNNSRNGLISPVVVYEDAYSMKKEILNENKFFDRYRHISIKKAAELGKAGIYKLTNKLTGDIYVGQSWDLGKRFTNYFNLSYINRRKELIISRALIKYGTQIFPAARCIYPLSNVMIMGAGSPARTCSKIGTAQDVTIFDLGRRLRRLRVSLRDSYCNESDLDIKEQYYFDTLNPKYNIQKIAGGSSSPREGLEPPWWLVLKG
jgi:hypothetical protein